VSELTKEKETAEARNAKLQKQLEKLKNAPKQPAQVVIDLPMQIATTTRGSNEVNAEADPEAYASL
jgi:predicted  nucleic acid-binding Zn-ribbon protein